MLLTFLAALTLVQDMTPAERAMLACRDKPDAERLACFDAATARLAPPVEAAAAPVSVPERAVPPAPVPRVDSPPAAPAPSATRAPEGFGLPEARDPDETLTAKIAAVTLDRYGKATVTLADGQVWRQISSDGTRISRGKARRAEEATVKRAALGSYRMTVEPAGRTIRVKRVE